VFVREKERKKVCGWVGGCKSGATSDKQNVHYARKRRAHRRNQRGIRVFVSERGRGRERTCMCGWVGGCISGASGDNPNVHRARKRSALRKSTR